MVRDKSEENDIEAVRAFHRERRAALLDRVARVRAAQVETVLSAEMQLMRAVREAVDGGVPVVDIARVMGVSRQAVYKLIHSKGIEKK